ncbi:MAG: DNA repair protein RecO [Pseudomonadales bacterium]
MSGVEQTRAFVLHQRPYRETSAIVDFLSTQGRVSAVCRGLRNASRAAMALRANIQPFAEVSLSYSGRSELKNLRAVEALQAVPALRRDTLYAALYLNELLLRLGHGNEFCSDIYHSYKNALGALRVASYTQLNGNTNTNSVSTRGTAVHEDAAVRQDNVARAIQIEVALRRFELSIIDTMGFAVDFTVTCDTHEAILAGRCYSYLPGQGFCVLQDTKPLQCAIGEAPVYDESRPDSRPLSVAGETLFALARDDFGDPAARRFAKQLTRRALLPLLGERPLKTRELYA